MFYDAASQIVTQVAIILAGFVAEYHADQFVGEHSEMAEIEDLLEQFDTLKEDHFSDLKACQHWMEKVTSFLPMLWD